MKQKSSVIVAQKTNPFLCVQPFQKKIFGAGMALACGAPMRINLNQPSRGKKQAKSRPKQTENESIAIVIGSITKETCQMAGSEENGKKSRWSRHEFKQG